MCCYDFIYTELKHLLQLSKRFQQPQAGATAQYERGAYMLDRLGLTVQKGLNSSVF